MNPDVGLNSDIKASKKRLHLQTSLLKEKSLLSLELFDGGELTSRRYQNVAADISEPKIQEIHNQIKENIEFLFEIKDDVRQRKNVPALVHLGRMFVDVGLYDQAVESLQYALRMQENSAVNFDLAKAYYFSEQFEKAVEQLNQSPEQYADVHFYRGLSLWKLDRYAEALKALRQAIKINTNYAEANFYYGYVLVDSCIKKPTLPDLASPIERLKQSERYFETAVLHHEKLDENLVESGLQKAQDSNFEEGLAILDQAHSKGWSETQKNWSSELFLRFMYSTGNESDVITHIIDRLSSLIDKYPEYADLRHALGSAYLIKGWYCFSKATNQFKKALDINPDFEKSLKNTRLLQNDGRGLLILLRAVLE